MPKPRNLSNQTSLRIDSFLYQLQGLSIKAVSQTSFDLVITDYSHDGSYEEVLSQDELHALKGGNHPKIVLAYMSIGEAENYRWYWNPRWDANEDGTPDSGAPYWLGPSNPEWEGNYKVKYWSPEWKRIIFGTPQSYLDKIIDAGFDGVYLDIIDAYEYWEPGGENGLDRTTSEQEMVDFVRELSEYAHVNRSRPDFLIVPQNGEELGVHPEYLDAIDGIGKEDTWYNDDARIDSVTTNKVLRSLDRFISGGKFVLCTDYVTQQDHIDDFYSKAIEKGYVPYATTRELDTLTINRGHEPG